MRMYFSHSSLELIRSHQVWRTTRVHVKVHTAAQDAREGVLSEFSGSCKNTIIRRSTSLAGLVWLCSHTIAASLLNKLQFELFCVCLVESYSLSFSQFVDLV